MSFKLPSSRAPLRQIERKLQQGHARANRSTRSFDLLDFCAYFEKMTYWISDFDLLDSFSVQKGHDGSDRSQIYLEFDEEDFATFERNIN